MAITGSIKNIPSIIEVLAKDLPNVFSFLQLTDELLVLKAKKLVPAGIKVTNFMDFLLEEKLVQYIILKNKWNQIERFCLSPFTKFELALSLLSKSYLTHYSALEIHGLTKTKTKQIFVTQELTPKSQNSSILKQIAVDAAFKKKQRPLNQIYKYRTTEFCLLNGKYSNRLGVAEKRIDEKNLLVTDLERTLIDAVVRPAYSGGIKTIMEAFKKARNHLDASKLQNYLQQLNFIYPYHQAIGFYMESTGYRKEDWELFLKMPQTINFYLDYNMQEKVLLEKWKLYIPAAVFISYQERP